MSATSGKRRAPPESSDVTGNTLKKARHTYDDAAHPNKAVEELRRKIKAKERDLENRYPEHGEKYDRLKAELDASHTCWFITWEKLLSSNKADDVIDPRAQRLILLHMRKFQYCKRTATKFKGYFRHLETILGNYQEHVDVEFSAICSTKIKNYICNKGGIMIIKDICIPFGIGGETEWIWADFTSAWEAEDWQPSLRTPPGYRGNLRSFREAIQAARNKVIGRGPDTQLDSNSQEQFGLDPLQVLVHPELLYDLEDSDNRLIERANVELASSPYASDASLLLPIYEATHGPEPDVTWAAWLDQAE